MADLTRRAFLRRTSALAAATWASPLLLPPGYASARARTLATVISAEGTTLLSTLVPSGDGGFTRLTEGPGWPFVVREELGATARAGREDRRTALASIVHLTDVHIIDTQAPTRVEFLDRDADPPQGAIPFESAWRAQETLTPHVADAMIQRVNAIARGPVTGRTFDVAVSTGDNIDNQQQNELETFLALFDGGPVVHNSGDPDAYEGTQDDDPVYYDVSYWHPDPPPSPRGPDQYKVQYGFPEMPGLLGAVMAPFEAVGLRTPWYSAYGNHDGLLSGNAPANAALAAFNTGPLKFVSRPAGITTADLQNTFTNPSQAAIQAFAEALLLSPVRPITADPKRRFIDAKEWVAMHLDSPATPGPVGHGYDQRNLDTGQLYYTFDITPQVLGICLDTVNRGGYAEGSIGRAQLDWLEDELKAVHSRSFDATGGLVDEAGTDRLVVLFSHHNVATLENPFPDPADPFDERVLGDEVVAFLHRWPNVVLWVNGHSHVNRVWAHADPSGNTPGFWELNTAAHCDYPEHARLVELVDNRDGTLSVFGTLIDSAAPAQAPYDATDVLGLASLSRELSANDPQVDTASKLGAVGDRNVELLVAAPFTLDDPSTPQPAPTQEPAPPPPALPSTGAGLAVTAIGAAVTGAVALRRRPPTD